MLIVRNSFRHLRGMSSLSFTRQMETQENVGAAVLNSMWFVFRFVFRSIPPFGGSLRNFRLLT